MDTDQQGPEPELVGSGENDFSIDGFDYSGGLFVASFTATAGGITRVLQEVIDFRAVGAESLPNQSLMRLLALACSTSYFKATPANSITIRFALSEPEKVFLGSLIRNGLAEFAYLNDLPEKLMPVLFAETRYDGPNSTPGEWRLDRRPLVAVGGGKDSVVTIEALKQTGLNPLLFSVNQFDPIIRCVTESGCDYLPVHRKIDPQLRTMNDSGASNGHVPVTAINSLIGLIVADIGGYGPVVMSNEGSANSGNLHWNGLEVNHQWSKSLQFEDLLRTTLTDSNLEEDRYFSLLRSFNEIQIGERFSKYPQYFSAFTSCNRVFKIDPDTRSSKWCGVCPKCQFVFLILAPFIPKLKLVEIFGHNLLEDLGNVAAYEEIIGVRGNKPFECVGEYEEAAEAFQRLSQHVDWHADAVVVALDVDSRAVAAGAKAHRIEDRVPTTYQGARDGVAARAA